MTLQCIYKEIAYQAIENNRDEPDVDIPESGKIPLYSVCPVYGISDTIFYFRIGHHTGTV